MTDDQTSSTFTSSALPRTHRFFEQRGVIFDTAIASPPLCCPARAAFVTAQYPHNNGVDSNAPGYPLLKDKPNTLAAWLDRAGYRTGFVGKYLNGYEAVAGLEPAPGWDSWFAAAGYPAYFDYEVSEDGELRRFGSGRNEYSTSVFTREALRFVGDSADRNRPFLLWLAYNAPHNATAGGAAPCDGEVPQPIDRAAYRPFARAQLETPPSFDERDVADKPEWLSSKAPLSEGELEQMTARWRCTLASLSSVDAGIQELVKRLRAIGELQNTAIVFVSDNGYFFGEHRIEGDKRLPYEPSARVPLAIKPPGSRSEPRGHVRQVVATVDLAPTLLDYAGAEPCLRPGRCRRLDGRSLRPLLEDRHAWRRDRGILIELDDGFTYQAIRTRRHLYTELSADRSGPLGEPAVELYDLDRDPHELENLARGGRDRHQRLLGGLQDRLESLRRCSGTTGGGSAAKPLCE